MSTQPLSEWEKDCLHWHSRALKGRFPHWCNDWDDLPIDETCDEIASCTCYAPSPEFLAVTNAAAERIDSRRTVDGKTIDEFFADK